MIISSDIQHFISIDSGCNILDLDSKLAKELSRDKKILKGQNVFQIIDINNDYICSELNNKDIISGLRLRLKNVKGTYNSFWFKVYSDNSYIINIVLQKINEKNENQIKILSKALEYSPTSIIITDKKGNIEYVNHKFIEITGYSLKEVLGKRPNFLKSGKYDNNYNDLWKTILSGDTWKGEFYNKKKNGELYWELASISPIFDNKNEITHFIAVKEDITDRKIMEDELKISKDKAEESDKLKSAFLANMSHEIRTPMNAIVGFSNILKDHMLDTSKKEEYIQIINNSTKDLLNLIDDIIDISKIDANQLKIKKESFNLKNLLYEIYALYYENENIKNKNIKIVLNENIDDFIFYSDKYRIKQILCNLINNAIKFSTCGGNVEFGFDILNDSNEINFFIKDEGLGIPKEKQKEIFERFIQIDEYRDFLLYNKGAGLGLSIVKSLTELLDGKINLISDTGKGTIFNISFPLEKRKIIKVKPDVDKNSDIKEIEKNWSDKTILVAEDNPFNKLLLETILKNLNLNVITSSNGLETIEKYKENYNNIDLILLDIEMPLKNGYEVLREIRRTNKSLIIIAQTAYVMPDEIQKALNMGFNDYITKPIDKKRLIKILEDYLFLF